LVKDQHRHKQRNDARGESLMSPRYRWTTIGSFALIFLGAFEALAVTTVMPRISQDLDGEALYSAAFSITLAASVVGMVVAGGWSDRQGPTAPLITAIAVFIGGLLLSGTALDMVVFLIGRLLQGLGAGAIGVALYVLVARIYPAALHPRIFGLFAAAWVLPSLLGPPVAGFVADTISWHWVFLGVAVLAIIFGGLVIPSLVQLRGGSGSGSGSAGGGSGGSGASGGGAMAESTTRSNYGHVVLAVVVAVGVVTISISGQSSGLITVVIAAFAFVVVVSAVRPLVPRGTLVVSRGLPSVVLLRGILAAAFFSTEVYLPYLLIDRYDLPSAIAGLILTIGAVSWALGSAAQSRLDPIMSSERILAAGAALVAVGLAGQFLAVLFALPLWLIGIAWLVGGAGMGLTFPRISTLALAYSTPSNQGFNSAAVQIMDATGGATAIAVAGLIFGAAGAASGNGFLASMAFSTVVALLTVPVALRTVPRAARPNAGAGSAAGSAVGPAADPATETAL
jgi:MFS family permease